jgi:hypothetical protein
MSHCIGVPAATLRLYTSPAVCVLVAAAVPAYRMPMPRPVVAFTGLVESVFVFTSRMKVGMGQVRLQGASCPFLFDRRMTWQQ